MGYDRNDRRYGYSDADRGRRFGGRDYDERSTAYGDYASYGGAGRRDYRGERFNDRDENGASPQHYDPRDRGFFDRAGDEVRSWFGDEDAERRRWRDERYDDEVYGREAYRGPDAGYGPPSDRPRRWAPANRADRHDQDPGYRSWRDRQMAAFDRDYDEYRRENQHRFDSEFGSWRQHRQGQRELLRQAQEHQEVVGADGQHIGTVDHVRGDHIQLTRSDKDAGGHHHLIPCSWIESVGDKVTVNKTAEQARRLWQEDQSERDGEKRWEAGNRGLGRSFPGTY